MQITRRERVGLLLLLLLLMGCVFAVYVYIALAMALGGPLRPLPHSATPIPTYYARPTYP